MPAIVKDILQNNKLLNAENTTVRARLQSNADFCMPRKADINSFRQKGDALNFGFLYDTVAIRSLKIAVAGFYSYFTNPVSQWFGLQANNPKIRKDKESQTYFMECTEAMNSVLSNTNFYSSTKEFYFDAIGLGTGTILSEADKKKTARFRCIPIQEMNFEEDEYGEINGAYWNFKLNPKQAFALWGSKAGKTVMETKDTNKAFEDIDFLLYVGERNDAEYGKIDPLNMPFKCCWIAIKDDHLIDEGGFEEFPFHVGRYWEDNQSVFGYCPSDDAIATIRLRNAQKKTALRRGMKETDPPLDVPAKGYMLPLNLNPAAMNIRDPKLAADNGVRAFGVGSGDFNITKEMMEDSKQEIEEHFAVPLFRAFSQITKTMTIPEVQERIREGMVLLGPAAGNLESPFKNAILRLFNIMSRNGELPEPPQSVQGQSFQPVFLSPLARAQREGEITSIRNFMADVGNIATLFPQARYKVNPFKTIDIIAEIRGVNPEILASQKDVDSAIEKEQKIAQMQMEMDMTHKAAGIAKTGAEAEATMAGKKAA